MTTKVHKVFVSYHHENDQKYRNQFEDLLQNSGISILKSVQMGDIDPDIQTDTIRRKIRDEYLRDSTVTVVLVGAETWKRKHVDWEIGSSIRDTQFNPRSGLLGILLPTYPLFSKNQFDPHTIPPRLYYNIECKFAEMRPWSTNSESVQKWIHEAFLRRNTIIPDNSYPSFKNNRNGTGWQ
jgi:hypothetical protein